MPRYGLETTTESTRLVALSYVSEPVTFVTVKMTLATLLFRFFFVTVQVPTAEVVHDAPPLAPALQVPDTAARQSKILLGLQADLSQPAFFEEFLRRQKVCIESEDHVEARLAYREGRTPVWG